MQPCKSDIAAFVSRLESINCIEVSWLDNHGESNKTETAVA